MMLKRDKIASNWITSLKEDTKGNIWVGTWDGGVTKVDGDELVTINTENWVGR